MSDDVCPECGGTEWLYNLRHGTSFCRGCGTVKLSELEEIKRETEQAAKLGAPMTAAPQGEGWGKLKAVERERLRSELNEAVKQEQLEIEARDVEMKAKGFTHRVMFWDHCTGGDDVQADVYFTADPKTFTITNTDGEVWSLWQEIKTVSIGDYKVIPL